MLPLKAYLSCNFGLCGEFFEQTTSGVFKMYCSACQVKFLLHNRGIYPFAFTNKNCSIFVKCASIAT